MKKIYNLKSNIDNIKRKGPKHLMKHLRTLSLMCLNPDPQKRPKIEWITICLREAL